MTATAAAVAEQVIAAFVLHAAWQLPVLVGTASCAVRWGRPSARFSHALWLATLVLCVALPLCSTLAARRAAYRAQHEAATVVSVGSADFADTLPALQRESAWKRLLHRHISNRSGVQPFAWALPQRWARALACAYLLVSVYFFAQLLWAWRQTHKLVRQSSADRLPAAVDALLHRLSTRIGVAPPPVRFSGDTSGPVLAGVLRPVLLLPAEVIPDLDSAQMEAVLAHELAHLRRHDPVLHALCSTLLVPLLFHPAARWLSRSVRQSREMACDALAAEEVGSRAAYAGALLQVAERIARRPSRCRASGFFRNALLGAELELFNRSGTMEERMQMLIGSYREETLGRRALRVAACGALGTVAVLAAGMLQVRPALADDRALPQTKAAQTDTVPESEAADGGPQLIGGRHAQKQLQHARRDLLAAEQQATTDEDRRRIATAREMAAAAERALAASGTPQREPVADLSDLHVQIPDFNKLEAQLAGQKAFLEQQQAYFNSPAWKDHLAQQQRAMDELRTRMNSPEFKAKIEASARIDSARMQVLMREAREQQRQAMEQIQSGAIQRQVEQATQFLARNNAPPISYSAVADEPVKVPSSVMAANATHKEPPTYPAEAKEKKIQGEVLLHAVISEEGKVEQLSVISSPDALLSRSATDAVSKWTYKPYLLHGRPVAVDTTVTVHYSFGG